MDKVLLSKLNCFLEDNDFGELYRSYNWGKDTWESGFEDIFRLEVQLSTNDLNNGITIEDVKDVARWGKLRNAQRIRGEQMILPRNTFYAQDCTVNPTISEQPLSPLAVLSQMITSGIGPTYFTKVLRFAVPTIYGALDTRCVRVFGKGDSSSKRHDWLDLTAKNYGYGWFIPETQKNWPSGYAKWLDILRTFCALLPANCPHPSAFVNQGLRSNGIWTCADVEMALFTYASTMIQT